MWGCLAERAHSSHSLHGGVPYAPSGRPPPDCRLRCWQGSPQPGPGAARGVTHARPAGDGGSARAVERGEEGALAHNRQARLLVVERSQGSSCGRRGGGAVREQRKTWLLALTARKRTMPCVHSITGGQPQTRQRRTRAVVALAAGNANGALGDRRQHLVCGRGGSVGTGGTAVQQPRQLRSCISRTIAQAAAHRAARRSLQQCAATRRVTHH